jgi:hypothetical protein
MKTKMEDECNARAWQKGPCTARGNYERITATGPCTTGEDQKKEGKREDERAD